MHLLISGSKVMRQHYSANAKAGYKLFKDIRGYFHCAVIFPAFGGVIKR